MLWPVLSIVIYILCPSLCLQSFDAFGYLSGMASGPYRTNFGLKTLWDSAERKWVGYSPKYHVDTACPVRCWIVHDNGDWSLRIKEATSLPGLPGTVAVKTCFYVTWFK